MTDLETAVAGIDAKTAADIPYNTNQTIKQHVDAMELICDREIWPYPTYGDILFSVK